MWYPTKNLIIFPSFSHDPIIFRADRFAQPRAPTKPSSGRLASRCRSTTAAWWVDGSMGHDSCDGKMRLDGDMFLDISLDSKIGINEDVIGFCFY